MSIKPVLIVVSILMVSFVFEMFQSFNNVVVASIFEPLFYLSNDMADTGKHGVKGDWFGFGVNLDPFTNRIQGFSYGLVFLFLKKVWC